MSSSSGRVIRTYRMADGGQVPLPVAPAAEVVAAIPVEPADVIANAEARARDLLAAAQQQAEAIGQQAWAAGFEEGVAAGQQQAIEQNRAQAEANQQQFQALVDSLVAERAGLLAAAEGDLVELALTIARKVIGDLATSQADVILQMAGQAIESMGRADTYTVHVNPADLARLEAPLAEHRAPDGWQLVADEQVEPGGCVVSAGASQVDARPSTQLDLIVQAFSAM